MKNGGKNQEKGDIMYDGSRGDSFLQRIAERRRFPHIHERNNRFWEETRLKKEKIPCHGNFEGTV